MGWKFWKAATAPLEVPKNSEDTTVETILKQMHEKRQLPMGVKAFGEWSDRIIAGALLTCEEGKEAEFIESQKFALADMIMHLGPSEDHKEDAHFIHYLRKVACNQIAHAMMTEIRDKTKARLAAQEAKQVKLEVVPTIPPALNEKPEILADQKIQGT